MNQAEERAPRARTTDLAVPQNFSGFQKIASLQLRKFRSRRGGRGCRGLVAVDAPDQFRTLCRSPRKKRRERRFPEACRPGLANASPKLVEVYQNPCRWGSGNVASFQLGAAGTRRLEGAFPVSGRAGARPSLSV